MNAATQQQQDERPIKKAYQSPELRRYGDLLQLTQASAWGSMWDGKSKGKSGMIFYT